MELVMHLYSCPCLHENNCSADGNNESRIARDQSTTSLLLAEMLGGMVVHMVLSRERRRKEKILH